MSQVPFNEPDELVYHTRYRGVYSITTPRYTGQGGSGTPPVYSVHFAAQPGELSLSYPFPRTPYESLN